MTKQQTAVAQDIDQSEERPVIWHVRLGASGLFARRAGPFDPLTIIMSVALLLNAYFQWWIIVALLITALAMRVLLGERQASEQANVEHEISPVGVRRDDKWWQWDEFASYSIYNTKTPGRLQLIFQCKDGKYVNLAMPPQAVPWVRRLADRRLPRKDLVPA